MRISPSRSGDYEAEVEGRRSAPTTKRCVMYRPARHFLLHVSAPRTGGASDLYPSADEAAFRAGLAPEVREVLAAPAPPPYVGDAAATIALMDRLLARWGDHPRITLAYGPAGPLWVGEGMLGALAADAARRGLGLHLHVLESRAQADAAARLFPEGTAAWLAAQGALGPNVTLAHCVYLTGDDIAAIADAGARIAHNPGSNLRLHNGAAPVPDFVAAGIEVGIGTDNTALADDEESARGNAPRRGARPRDAGRTPPRRRARDPAAHGDRMGRAQRLSRGRRHHRGRGQRPISSRSISGARHARCSTPDQTLLNAFTARARGADVRLTMIDGAILYEGGRHTRLDPQTEIEAAVSGARAARLSPRPAAAGATLPLREAVRDAYGLPRAPRHRDWA